MIRLRRLAQTDLPLIAALIGIWLLFFWRLLTPVAVDQASIIKGDFSGQFVAFAAYQFQRFSSDEVPLWNPYNNGGLPFIGDTQAAVFYPPRLITIALASLSGGWTYHALELEMMIHVLAGSLFMYGLVRRITAKQAGSKLGAFIAAVIFSYGGFMQSYPPLQLAILEAAVWLPLAILGIHEATAAHQLRWRWLLLTGLAFGVSWMAGHPQTSWFTTYLLTAYLAFRGFQQRYRWRTLVGGIILFGLLGGGLAAVQLLPGVEYLVHTTRTGLGFDAKGNGFPIQDLIQFIWPNILSQWSPLYIGLAGLLLAAISLWRHRDSRFWGIVALIALGLSFGNNSPVYSFFYNLLPGLRFFRGQERAAFIIAFSLALLAGTGASHMAGWEKLQDVKATRRVQQVSFALVALCAGVMLLVWVAWLGNHDGYGTYLQAVSFSLLIAVLTAAAMMWLLNQPRHPFRQIVLAIVLLFDLFALSMDNRFNYDPIPPQDQLSMTPPPLVATALADSDTPFRVDGYRGLHDNFGSLYQLADMRGISPLFLDGPNAIINQNLINPVAWELFAVRYVFTDWEQMPVPSTIVGSGQDRYGTVSLHRLTNPRPFAHLVYESRIVASEQEARDALNDSSLNIRRTVILEQAPRLALNPSIPENAYADVTRFTPEQFTIAVDTPTNAILSVAHPYYPGWVAALDGTPVPLLRAFGALSAVEVPAGQHTITFYFNPLSYRIGAAITVFAWLGLIAISGLSLIRRKANGQYSTRVTPA